MSDDSRANSAATQRELEFVSRIDCRFPYDDEQARAQLFSEAASISANAELMVLHELLRVPSGVSLSTNAQSNLLSEWRAASRSVLCVDFASIAVTKCLSEAVTRQDVEALASLASRLPGAYNALGILDWFSDEVLSDDESDEQRRRIELGWQR